MVDFPHENITRLTIGIAFRVYNTLGYGVREQYVHRAFCAEFASAGIAYRHEVSIPLLYAGERIGTYRLDFILAEQIIMEFKMVPVVKHIHVKQVLEYLRATEKQLALLLFFTPMGVRVKRVILPQGDGPGIRSLSAPSAQ